jgi:hypothetical protein
MDNPEKQATLDTQDTRRRRKKPQAKTTHTTIGVGHHYAQTYTYNVNKT